MTTERFSILSWLRLSVAVLGLGFAARSLHAQATIYTWTSGDIQTGSITPHGTTIINAPETMNIISGNDHDFDGLTVTNNGTINWNLGGLRSGHGGNITNNSIWNDSSGGYSFNNAYGGTGGTTFINTASGTYNKTAGASTFATGFTNAGHINVTGGSLILTAGGTFTNGSVVGSSGSGVLQLTGGALTMTGNITATNFLFNGGVFSGDQTFTASVVNWQAGTWNSANTTTIASNSTLNLVSGNDHDIDSHAIVNNGTINWTTGNLRGGHGGTITNNATWADTADTYQINNAYGGASGTSFINAAGGSYLKLSGTSTFSIGLSNYGTVLVSGGILNLAAGGTFYDGSSIGSTGTGVVQLTGGVLTGGGAGGFTATNFLLTGGRLSGNMTFLGSTNWVGSDFNTVGTATVGASGILDITTGNDHDFDSHAMVNNGTVNWLAGNLRSGHGGTITNNATWNDSANGYQVNAAYGGSVGTTFTNATTGIYNKTVGVTTFGAGILVNNGTISVSGGRLDLVGGTLNNGSTIGSSGSGVVQLTSGLLTANGTINVQNLVLNGGQLDGTHTFAGTLTWQNGTLNNTGTTTVGNGSTLSITTGNDHDFDSHAIANNGTVNWLAGNLRSGHGGTITNNATWNDSVSGYQINGAYGGSVEPTFINGTTGIYNKTAGTTTLSGNMLVNNGTISVTGGLLNLDGGVLNNGSTIGSSGAGVVQLSSGSLTANGTINVQNFLLNGGKLQGVHTLVGSAVWQDGTLNNSGSTTIGNASTLGIATGNDHNFESHAIVNNGTVNWTTGNLRAGNGATITNNSVWNDSTSGYQINNAYGGAGGTTFINTAAGIYNKTAGTTTIQVPFSNAGTVNLTGGTLAFSGTFNNTGTVAVATGTTLSLPSPATFAAGSLLSGTGNVAASALTIAGKIAPGTTTTAGLLTITGNLTLAGTSQSAFELGGVTQSTQYDNLTITGDLSLGGSYLAVTFINGFENSVTNGMTFTIMTSANLLNSLGDVANGARMLTADLRGTFVVNYGASSQFGVNNVVLSSFVAVPEPSTWMLLLTGAGMLAISARRRARSRRN